MPLTLNGTTGISFPDGSSGTPALRGTDSDTGVFFPAADTIALVEGGTEVLRVTSAGTVGIGTTNPAEKLQVQGRVVGTSGLRAGTTAAIASSGELLSVLGQATIRLDSPTSAATYLINADTTASTIQPFLLCNDTGGNRAGIGVEYSSAIASFYGHLGISLQTGSTAFGYANERVRITSTGNVGIGTNSPTAKLTITDGVAAYAASTGDLLHLKRGVFNGNDTTSATAISLSNNSNGFRIAYGGTSDRLRFIDGGAIEIVSLVNGGNVGIGATNPTNLLTVNNTAQVSDFVAGYFGSNALGSGESRTWVTIQKGNLGANYGGAIGGYLAQGVGGGLLLGTQNSNAIPVERLRITTAGNVGIGITNPASKLVVSGFINETLYTQTHQSVAANSAITLISTSGTTPTLGSAQNFFMMVSVRPGVSNIQGRYWFGYVVSHIGGGLTPITISTGGDFASGFNVTTTDLTGTTGTSGFITLTNHTSSGQIYIKLENRASQQIMVAWSIFSMTY